jgi:hypothetical protein
MNTRARVAALCALVALEIFGFASVCLMIPRLTDRAGRILLAVLWIGLFAKRLRRYLFS